MPLAFPSCSHGTIAFGFFNIETDLLLLQDLFFFADGFCQAICTLDSAEVTTIDGFTIPPERAGNVNLAIAGDQRGLIGATYRLWPFPEDPAGFKQKPDGQQNRTQAEALLEEYGTPTAIRLSVETEEVQFGDYRFTLAAFSSLIRYVDRGGYPRWQDEERPSYVRSMMDQLQQGASPLLDVLK